MKFRDYITEKKIDIKQYEDINNMKDLQKLMKSFKDGKIRTVSIDFGVATISTYDKPSDISFRHIGASGSMGVPDGYWKNGKFFEHSKKKKEKHEKWYSTVKD
jgi:hypothetical protein